MKNLFSTKQWGSLIEIERKHRIDVAVWAYSYEYMNDSLVSDEVFDKTCLAIDKNISTGNTVMDNFFSEKFESYTGSWVVEHPELKKLHRIYEIKKSCPESQSPLIYL